LRLCRPADVECRQAEAAASKLARATVQLRLQQPARRPQSLVRRTGAGPPAISGDMGPLAADQDPGWGFAQARLERQACRATPDPPPNFAERRLLTTRV